MTKMHSMIILCKGPSVKDPGEQNTVIQDLAPPPENKANKYIAAFRSE